MTAFHIQFDRSTGRQITVQIRAIKIDCLKILTFGFDYESAIIRECHIKQIGKIKLCFEFLRGFKRKMFDTAR